MKKILKWAALVVVVIAMGGFLAFVYSIPPFFTTSPEKFSSDVRDAAPPTSKEIAELKRTMAERGREIVVRTGCIGCHAANGPKAPITPSISGAAESKSTRPPERM